MNNEEFSKLMADTAEDAISFIESTGSPRPDYSLGSLTQVDQLIKTLSEQHLDEKEMFTYSYMLGAYVGEVYKKEAGGEWLFIEETEEEPPQTFFKNEERSIAFPGKIYHALFGQEETISEYIEQLLES
ncbi:MULTISPECIES: hypothetical protein [unclassified Agarivorans]|uniref:hypothetical protein n=1 Tax=unclassified Agarivorans TaxID=2636026 RepID=UPI0026E44847|nr:MULTISPECIES: hypothetical protein [unclassified Agarivorans]MDO6684705.1 hypothetical protein [Agarivorans sp. 3_MG-2023]MDO6715134.1 hypothetical protein [Agarivorans sp. 2_MG-2023]MDO6763946.1 hypothetical protein [Agarivorans sp. 1_MG-2023]